MKDIAPASPSRFQHERTTSPTSLQNPLSPSTLEFPTRQFLFSPSPFMKSHTSTPSSPGSVLHGLQSTSYADKFDQLGPLVPDTELPFSKDLDYIPNSSDNEGPPDNAEQPVKNPFSFHYSDAVPPFFFGDAIPGPREDQELSPSLFYPYEDQENFPGPYSAPQTHGYSMDSYEAPTSSNVPIPNALNSWRRYVDEYVDNTEFAKVMNKLGTVSGCSASAAKRKFKCPIEGCVADFTQHGSLRIHLNSHYGLAKKTCHFCGQCFNTYTGLKRHIKHHSMSDSREPNAGSQQSLSLQEEESMKIRPNDSPRPVDMTLDDPSLHNIGVCSPVYSSSKPPPISFVSTASFDHALIPEEHNPGGHKSREDTHTTSRSSPAPNAISTSSSACLSAPVDVMNHLIETKGDIEALFRVIDIDHNNVTFAAGLDEEAFGSGGMLIQQAYILTRVDLPVDPEQITRFLDALGKKLSPYGGVVSTPSRKYYPPIYLTSGRCTYDEFISFHARPLGVSQDLTDQEIPNDSDTPSNGSTSAGNGGQKDQGNDGKHKGGSGSRDNEGEGSPSNSASGSGNSDSETKPGLQSMDVDNDVRFDVGFSMRYGEENMPNQTIRIQGIVHSKEIPYPMPHAILSSRVRFDRLDFYGNTGNTGFRQSRAVIKIDGSEDQGHFELFDVSPECTSRQDTQTKQVVTHERTRQHQVDLSACFALLSTFGGKYSHTTGNKAGTAEERSLNINRIFHTKTRRGMFWTYYVDDEYMRENGLRSLAPSASFSFYGAGEGRHKPRKLNIEISSTWTMPDAGLWDIRSPFMNIPFRNLATRVSFDIPPHMTKSWAVFRDLGITIIPRHRGKNGVKVQVEDNDMIGDIEMQDFV